MGELRNALRILRDSIKEFIKEDLKEAVIMVVSTETFLLTVMVFLL